jgi:hypothetical protein
MPKVSRNPYGLPGPDISGRSGGISMPTELSPEALREEAWFSAEVARIDKDYKIQLQREAEVKALAESKKPTAGLAFTTAFRDAHTIMEAADWLTRPQLGAGDPAPPGWRVQPDDLIGYEPYAYRLVDATSPGDLAQRKLDIDNGKRRREIIANGGAAAKLGTLAGIATDPLTVGLMFIPWGGQEIAAGRITASFLKNAVVAAAGEVPASVMRHYTRPDDLNHSILADSLSAALWGGAIASGIAGGFKLVGKSGELARAEIARMLKEDGTSGKGAQFSADDALEYARTGEVPPGAKPPADEEMTGMGAAAVRRSMEGGRLTGWDNTIRRWAMWPILKLSPEGRTLMSNHRIVRVMAQRMADTGLEIEGGVRVAAQTEIQMKASETMSRIMEIEALARKSGMDRNTFYEQMHYAQLHGGGGAMADNPHVREAVKIMDAEFKAKLDDAVEAEVQGSFTETRTVNPETGVITVDRKPIQQTTAGGYWTRMWNAQKILDNPLSWWADFRAAVEKRHAQRTERWEAESAVPQRELAQATELAEKSTVERRAAEEAYSVARAQATGAEARLGMLRSPEQMVGRVERLEKLEAASQLELRTREIAVTEAQGMLAAVRADAKNLRELIDVATQDIVALRKAGNKEALPGAIRDRDLLKDRLERRRAQEADFKAARDAARKTMDEAAQKAKKAEGTLDKARRELATREARRLEAEVAYGAAVAARRETKAARGAAREAEKAALAVKEASATALAKLEEKLKPDKLPENELEWAHLRSGVMNAITNQREASYFLPDVGGASAAPLKHRMEVNDLDVFNWLEHSAPVALSRYHFAMDTKTALARRFNGDYTMKEEFEKLDRYFNAERQALERRDDLSPAQVIKEQRKVDKQRRDAFEDLEFMRDDILGRHKMPTSEAEKAAVSAMRAGRSYNTMLYMGMAAAAQLPDVANAIARNIGGSRIFQNLMHAGIRGVSDPLLRKAAPNQLRALAIAFDQGGVNSVTRFGDVAERDTFSAAERMARQGAEISMHLSLTPHVTTIMKDAVANSFIHDIMTAAQSGARPTKFALDQLGIDAEMWARIAEQSKLRGYYANEWGNTGWDLRIEKWEDKEARTALKLGLVKHVNNVITTPTNFTKPSMFAGGATFGGEIGKMASQFTSTMFSYTHDIVLPMIQSNTATRAFLWTIATVPLATASYYLRNWAYGIDTSDKPTYREVRDIIDRTGLFGVWYDLYQKGERALGMDPAGMLIHQLFPEVEVGGVATKYAKGNFSVLGPSANTVERAVKLTKALLYHDETGAMSPDVDTAVHNLKLLSPLNQNIYLARIAKELEERTAQMLGGTGEKAQPPSHKPD